MINFFWKVCLIMMTINIFMYIILGQSQLGGQFGWMSSNQQDLNSNIYGNADFNAAIQQTGQGSTSSVPPLFSFIGAAGFIFNLGYNILFGYFTWMAYLLPQPLVIAIGVPISFIMLMGLFSLLQSVVGVILFALRSFI